MHIVLWQEAVGFVFWFLYGSFFEWWFHKYLFHSPKIIKRPFAHHTMVHHQLYRWEMKSYEWQAPAKKDHITMDWWALPIFLAVHAPIMFAIDWLTHTTTALAGLVAIVSYYAIYEYFHFAMHVPGKQAFQRTKVFQFAKEHHRVHHKYMLHNLNVFFPFADVILGTYRTETTPARNDRNKGRNRQRDIERVKADHAANGRKVRGSGVVPKPVYHTKESA